ACLPLAGRSRGRPLPQRSGGHIAMIRRHARPIAGIGSRLLLLLLASAGAAWGQGAPSLVWSSPDGAGTLAFSASGQMLASAGGTTIFVRRAADGALVRMLMDRSGINSVAFSPDGQLLADGR